MFLPPQEYDFSPPGPIEGGARRRMSQFALNNTSYGLFSLSANPGYEQVTKKILCLLRKNFSVHLLSCPAIIVEMLLPPFLQSKFKKCATVDDSASCDVITE